MEIKDWTYEDLPEFEGCPEGAKLIDTTGDEIALEYYPDVVYAKTPQGDLRLQIIVPVCRNGIDACPAVVFVQGSAWGPQERYKHLSNQFALANRGFVVAAVEYRDHTRAKFPTPILDCMNAVRFLRKHALDYHVDADNIFVAGDSSGGHTALMAGFWCKEEKGDNYYPGVSAKVNGIISQFASSDFLFEDSNPTTVDHTKATSPEGKEMGGVDMTPEMCEMLTCRTYVTPEADIPPVLMFHGTKDRLVNTKNSVYLYERLKECGKEVEFYLLKGADHGGGEFWTKTTLDIMESFIRKRLHRNMKSRSI